MPEEAVGGHRRLFERAVQLASMFRDRVGERAPRPVITASDLLARFEGPTPEIGEEPLTVLDALNAAAEPGLTPSNAFRFYSARTGTRGATAHINS